jgi:hypothetical protein
MIGGVEDAYSAFTETLPEMLVIIVVLVTLVIIISVIVICYIRISRPKNTIYAGETEEKDENEMGTAEVKSKYKLSEVYQLPERPVAE